MEKWCVVDPDGVNLPEPLADSAAEVIEAFCALSEMHPNAFTLAGYSTAKYPLPN